MSPTGRALRGWFAALGALSSAVSVFAYYLPGVLRSDGDVVLPVLLVAFPAAALALPFAVVALVLRTPVVIAVTGVLLLVVVYTGVYQVHFVSPTEELSGLVAGWLFFLAFAFQAVLVAIGVVVDLAVRGALRLRRRAAADGPGGG